MFTPCFLIDSVYLRSPFKSPLYTDMSFRIQRLLIYLATMLYSVILVVSTSSSFLPHLLDGVEERMSVWSMAVLLASSAVFQVTLIYHLSIILGASSVPVVFIVFFVGCLCVVCFFCITCLNQLIVVSCMMVMWLSKFNFYYCSPLHLVIINI